MPRKHIIVPMHIWDMTELTVTERLVGSVIYGYSEHGKPCFMTNTGLSMLLHVSRRTVSASVCNLIDQGYVMADRVGSKRTLGWKKLPTGLEKSATPLRSQLPTVIHNYNTEPNTDHNKMMEEEKKPLHWQQVRDYFTWINDKERGNNAGHVVSWAKDFFTYYDARNWRNKHGAITRWKPVAEAWYRRSAKNVPQRAVQKRDDVQVRNDIAWHRRRAEAWAKNPDKAHLAEEERRYADRLEQSLMQGGR